MNTDTNSADYIPGGGRSQFAIIMLGTSILIDVAAVGSGVSQYSLLNVALSGGGISNAAAETNDMIYGGIGILQVVAFILTATAFLMWFHRAHKNLGSFNITGLKYSPGWAVGGFFVPFLNLVRPYQVAKEIWQASGPKKTGNTDLAAWVNEPVSGLLKGWWAFFLVGSIVANISGRMMLSADSLNDLLSSTAGNIAADALSIIGAILAIKLVKAIDIRQEQRHRTQPNN